MAAVTNYLKSIFHLSKTLEIHSKSDFVKQVFQFLESNNESDAVNLLRANYGNSDDPFHQEVSTLLKNFLLYKYSSKEDLIKWLQDPMSEISLVSISRHLLLFQESFPEIFNRRGYAEELELLKDLSRKYGVELQENPDDYCSKDSTLSELESKSTLVLGCGPNISQCGGHDNQSTLFLNCNAESGAQLLGDYFAKETWNLLPDNHFLEIFYEGFNPKPCNRLKDVQRVLASGGKARIYFCEFFDLIQKEGDLDQFLLERCGFSSYEIRSETFRSCGREEPHQMLIAYKK